MKLRKEATRRCRNCLTAYKVQTPGGGKFMCTYCGHVSKRPVLEVPGTFPCRTGPSMTGTSFAGAFSVSQQGNGGGVRHFRGLLRGSKPEFGSVPQAIDRGGCTWSGSLWPFGARCAHAGQNGLHESSSSPGESTCGQEKCRGERSSLGALSFFWRSLFFVGWVWKKVLAIGQSRKDGTVEGAWSSRGNENLDSFQGSRGEKARRRAKERRLARLEKEIREAEERKQREEVACLVEERRRQRKEKMEVDKERESEVAAERDTEIEGVRDAERQPTIKAKEGVREQGKDTTPEQEPEVTLIKNKISGELKGGGTRPRSTAMKGVQHFKSAEAPRGLMHDQGFKFKAAVENCSRSGYTRYVGNAKRGPLSICKTGTLPENDGWGRRAVERSHTRGNFTKTATPIATGSFNLSPNSDGVPLLSGSAWKKAPWSSTGSEVSARESTSMQTVMADGIREGLDQKKEDAMDLFTIKESIIKPSQPLVRVTPIQPPIAPPSTHMDSLHQLFSSPSIFSPMDLAVDFQKQHEQKSQTEIRASIPGHTFFETPMCVSVRPPEPYAQSSISTSAPMSIPVPPWDLTGPQNKNAMIDMDVPQPSLPLGPVSGFVMRSSPAEVVANASTGVEYNSISPCSVSVPDRTVEYTSGLLPSTKLMKTDWTDLHSDEDNSRKWDFPSMPLEDPNGTMEGEMWQIPDDSQLCEMKMSESLTCIQNDELPEFQLPHLSTVQLSFDLETQVQQSPLFVLQEHASLKPNGDETAGGDFVSNRQSYWFDIPAFQTTMPTWDDPDIHPKMPPEFVDCITQEIMADPVITADGHSYERAAIEKWLKLHDTSPKTGEVLPPPANGIGVDKTLRPNHILRGQIIEYKEQLAKMSKMRGATLSTTKGGDYPKISASHDVCPEVA